MSLKRGRDALQDSEADPDQRDDEIYESSSIEDRASRFIALFSPIVSARDLQAHLPYKKASHRILAWRKPSAQQSLTKFKASGGPSAIYTTGFDDDGEKYAGKRLEKLLIDLDIEGAVVVARWYGGVLLGPVRFAHIEQVARDAINKWRASRDLITSPKKQKTAVTADLSPTDEAEQKTRLSKVLVNRDNSIKVLRELLAEKKAVASLEQKASEDKTPSTPSRPQTSSIDYSSMPLNKLRQLEKARDTTISWILKQIDEAETKASPGTATSDFEPGQ